MNILPEKSIFSLVKEKIVKKFPPIFQNFASLQKKLSRLAFLGEKLQKFANLGVKTEK